MAPAVASGVETFASSQKGKRQSDRDDHRPRHLAPPFNAPRRLTLRIVHVGREPSLSRPK